MSIYFDFDVGPGRRFRKAVLQDKLDVELLMDNEETKKVFQGVDIGSLIELSVLSICMINEDSEILGFMSLNDYPNIDGVDPSDWELWIRNMFQKYYLSRNTLFIHCACCQDTVIEHFLEEALLSVFKNDTYLLQIVLFVTANCNIDNLLQNKTFKKRRMNKHLTKHVDCETRTHYMYVANRDEYYPKLRIRRAVEEDNDDIVELLDEVCPRLKEMYGDFYISELVGCHPEDKRKIIVAESQEKAVGVMCLNSNIDYKKLQNIYELKPWFGLKKATPLEKEQHARTNVLLSVFGEPIMMGKWGQFDEPPDLPKEKVIIKKRKIKKQVEDHARIIKTRVRKQVDSIEINYDSIDYNSDVFSLASNKSHISLDILLEEDPFDYEIVNIDKDLLTVPTPLRYAASNTGMPVQQPKVRIIDCNHPPQQKWKPQPKRLNSVYYKERTEYQIYHGEPNAFSIELFGLRKDIDQRRAFDLLEVAFEIMKDFDYCIIRVPSSDKSFPLLQHFCYVPTKPRLCCKYSLYVAHRSSVFGKLRVRAVELADIPRITQLLQNIQCKETICTIERSILHHDDTIHGYVFMSGLSIVGFAILDELDQLDFVRVRYSLELQHNHKYHRAGQGGSQGFSNVKIVIAYHAFEPHFRYFAREIMRLSGSYSLIWMTTYRNKWVADKANSIVSAMIPLVPRLTSVEVPPVPELKILAAMEKKIPSFNTWFLDKKLTSVPLVTVSTRIVLIGSSRTAFAFINALIFGQSNSYLSFSDVTLISPHGLPYLKHKNPAAKAMFPIYHCTSEKCLKSIPYYYYVNMVLGSLTSINRQEKYVTLTNGSKYYYDILVLLMGKQYQHPDYLKPELDEETTMRKDCSAYLNLDIPRKRIVPQLVKYETPDNVFLINDLHEAHKALRYVKSTYHMDFNAIYIVYGATIDAYCCLTGLLETIPPKNIIFVEPFPSEDRFKTRISPFSNSKVDETVNNVIETLGIKVYRSYYFKSWTVHDDLVTEVEFLSKFHMAKLKCTALFYYGKRGVDTKAYLAVNECGMGYDGGILIDHEFRTKDPCIYAAGPCTAYYRRYFAMDKKQKYFDSKEVGYMLGSQIRNQYDPLFTEKPKTRKNSVRFSTTESITGCGSRKNSIIEGSEKAIDKIPNFKDPRIIYCKLPGGLQFLQLRAPGKKLPHPYLQMLHFSGHILETFKNGYFKLHMNNDLVVDAVTCLTREKYNLEIFRHIYGLPSAVLNNVHLKFMTKRVDNFYEFFRSPWAYFLYHDQCDELFAMVKELLPGGQANGDTVAAALHKIRTSISMSPRDSTVKNEIKKRFDATPHIEAISKYVLEWLEENDVVMTMYLQPPQRTTFLYDLERNFAFKKKKTSISELVSKTIL